MNEISKEYGTALFMLACEEKKQESYGEALENVKNAFLENPEYAELLASPGVSLNERLKAIDAVFADRIPEHILYYLKLLCEKGRILYFIESVREYNALLDASKQISNAKITSAVELTENEKQKLITKLESIVKGKVEAEYFVDADLLGGFIVEIDGKIMDGSLRHRLHEIKGVINT